jgi:hypothetical protein
MAIVKRLNVLLNEEEVGRLEKYSKIMNLSYSKTAIYVMKMGMAVVDIGLDPQNEDLMVRTMKKLDQENESAYKTEKKHPGNGKSGVSKVRKLAKQ